MEVTFLLARVYASFLPVFTLHFIHNFCKLVNILTVFFVMLFLDFSLYLNVYSY